MDIILLGGFALGAFSIILSSIVAYQSNADPKRQSRSMHDAPQIVMYIVGTWIFIPLGYIWAIAYAIIAIVTNLWYMTMICPNCIYHGKTTGASLLCGISGSLARKGDMKLFARQFKKNIGVVITGWVLPLFGSGLLLYQKYGDTTQLGYNIFMLTSFCIIAFFLLPKAAEPGCRRCAMKNNCPWRKPSK
jgi:hypothetical protein